MGALVALVSHGAATLGSKKKPGSAKRPSKPPKGARPHPTEPAEPVAQDPGTVEADVEALGDKVAEAKVAATARANALAAEHRRPVAATPTAQPTDPRRRWWGFVAVLAVVGAVIGIVVVTSGDDTDVEQVTVAEVLEREVPAGARVGVVGDRAMRALPDGTEPVPVDTVDELRTAEVDWVVQAPDPPAAVEPALLDWLASVPEVAAEEPDAVLYDLREATIPAAQPSSTTTLAPSTTSSPSTSATTTPPTTAPPTTAPPTTAPPTTAPPTTAPPTTTPPAAPGTVVVVPGDSFWVIAEREVTASLGRAPTDAEVAPYWVALIDANAGDLVDPGNPDLILPGQTFVVPP